jgi:ABC-type amino acid transport system permease subunit
VALAVTPFLAILFWFHYPLQGLLGVVWPPEPVATLLLAGYVCVHTSDIFADELIRARRLFQETAQVLGIFDSTFHWRIVAPAAAEATLPRLLSLSIATVHMTMFASLIGVEELFRAAQRVTAQTLHPVQVYGAMAAFYAAICLPMYLAAHRLNRRLRRGGSVA